VDCWTGGLWGTIFTAGGVQGCVQGVQKGVGDIGVKMEAICNKMMCLEMQSGVVLVGDLECWSSEDCDRIGRWTVEVSAIKVKYCMFKKKI